MKTDKIERDLEKVLYKVSASILYASAHDFSSEIASLVEAYAKLLEVTAKFVYFPFRKEE